MHNWEEYDGKRVEDRRSRHMTAVQFPNKERMDGWLEMMRRRYPKEQFGPFVNQKDNIVVY